MTSEMDPLALDAAVTALIRAADPTSHDITALDADARQARLRALKAEWNGAWTTGMTATA